jgi:hypothetical protein
MPGVKSNINIRNRQSWAGQIRVSLSASAVNIADYITGKGLLMDHKAIRIILASISIIVTALLLTACGAQASNPNSPAQSTAGEAMIENQGKVTATPQQVESNLNDTSAKEAIVYALQALGSQPNTMDVTTTLADGSTQQAVIVFVPPDRKHITDKSTGVEYIIIGQLVYSRDGTTGQWVQTSIPASTFMGDNSQAQQSVSDSISEVQILAPFVSDGQDLYVVRYLSTTSTNGIDLHSQIELWLDQSDGLAYKMITDGETYTASTDPASEASKAMAVQAQTTTTITYDPHLEIEAPLP